MFFRRVVIFAERNLAGSKAFSHASAPRDYMSLPTLTRSKVIPPCTSEITFPINQISPRLLWIIPIEMCISNVPQNDKKLFEFCHLEMQIKWYCTFYSSNHDQG